MKDGPFNPKMIEKVQNMGYSHPSFLKLLTNEEFCDLFEMEKSFKNLSEIQKFRNQKSLSRHYNISQEYRSKSHENFWILPTGCHAINELLDFGGLKAGEITLFYGKARTGKTQLVHDLCIQTYLHFPRKTTTKLVMYIDSENTFRPERIIQISKHYSISSNDILNKIYVEHVPGVSALENILPQIYREIQKNNVKILIIDSLTKIFRLALAESPQGFPKIIKTLSKILQHLQTISENANIPIVCTSQVTATFDATHYFEVIPVLSTTINHYIKQWILLAENEALSDISPKKGLRFAHLINGELKPEAIVKFRITNGGIVDEFG